MARHRIDRREQLDGRRFTLGWIATHVLLPIVLLIVFASAIVLVRLLNGPISLSALAGPIARSISSELSGLSVSVEDAIVRLTSGNELEFRLRNVRVNDGDGQPIAIAPLAALSLSQAALWSGRLTPEHIVLIEPRLLLQVADAAPTGVAGSVAEQASNRDVRTAGAGPTAQDTTALDETALRQIEVTRALREAIAGARTRTSASGYLKRIGLRQGTLVLVQGSRRGQLRVLEANLELDHKKRRSSITGWAQFESARGPWQLDLKAAEGEKEDRLSVTLDIADLVPAALADLMPANMPFAALDAPVSGRIEAEIAAEGRIASLTGTLDVGAGNIRGTRRSAAGPSVATRSSASRGIDSARIVLAYDPERRRIDIKPSTLVSGGSRIVVTGTVSEPQQAGQWQFALAASEGMLSPSEPGAPALPLEALSIDGRFEAHSGRFEITRGLVRAGGAEIRGDAVFPAAGEGTPSRLDIKLGPMGHRTAKALWPAIIAPGAREWVAARLSRGLLTGGTIRLEPGPSVGGEAQSRLVMMLEITDAEVSPLPGFATLEAPRASVKLEGATLDVTVADATLAAGPGRRLGLKAGRFAVADITADQPLGEISARIQGTLPAALAVLDREPIALGAKAGGSLEGIDGKVEGPMRIVVPLEKDVLLRDVQLEGKLKITEARGKAVLGGFDLQGGSLAVDVADAAIEVRGDLLVQGVAARLSAQHLLRAEPDRPQPPIRIIATLDGNDRASLGFDTSHYLTGDVAVEVVVPRTKGETPRVRADLTAATLVIEPIAWVKPAGRSAVLSFDLGRGVKYKTEFQNLKLVGDDIAVDGWIGLDASNRMREIYLPEIALNLISRFELTGTLRQDNVWDVRLKGPTLDGKDLFRSLFSVGQIGADKAAPQRTRETKGVDIRADFDTVLGFSDLTLKGVKISASKRQDRLTALSLKGDVEGGRPLEVALEQASGQPRTLLATSEDAGQVFRLIGFYPSMQGGRLRLILNLDGRGPAEKTGVLQVQRFRLLGDPVVEVLSTKEDVASRTDAGGAGPTRRPRTVRQVVEFDSVQAPFAVGYGQFVIEDADLRGPLFGANLRGKADFRSRTVNLAGTYAPLQGLNAAIAVIPGIGQILAGPRGEGVFAITFVVQGPMAEPNVLFNPFSLLTPGFLREITQLSNPSTQVTPTVERPQPRRAPAVRASSTTADTPGSTGTTTGPPAVQPKVGGAWTSGTEAPVKSKRTP